MPVKTPVANFDYVVVYKEALPLLPRYWRINQMHVLRNIKSAQKFD